MVGIRLAAAALLTTLALAPTADAQEGRNGLPELLALIPAGQVDEADAFFYYADLEAMTAAAGIALQDDPQAVVDGFWRFTVGPGMFTQYLLQYDRMREVVGFGLADMARVMSFGTPPGTVTVVAGGPGLSDMAALDAALGPRGFTLTETTGLPVWESGEDYSIDLLHRDVADPFGGYLGQASRIAVANGLLIRAAGWPNLRQVLAVRAGKAQGLTGVLPALPAAVRAVTALPGVEGPVIQAVAFPASALVPEPGRGAPAPAGDPLPPFPFVFLADLQAGREAVNAIVLPYPDFDTAAEAAAIVKERLTAWPRTAEAGLTVESILAPIGGGETLAILWVRLSPETHHPVLRAGLNAWFQAILSRQFTPLSVP